MSPLQQKALRLIFEELKGAKSGMSLPSERECAARAAVGRTVIRGLMAKLARKGVVRRRGRVWVLRVPVGESLLKLAPERLVSRRQQVKDHLLAELGSGRLQPGQRLTEVAIAKKLGVATISVREAMLEMAPLGVFSKSKTRQWSVVAFTPEKIAMMREFREMVETYCLRKLMAQGPDPQARQELEAIRAETEIVLALRRAGVDRILRVDLRLHRFLLEAAGNPLVAERAEFIYAIIGFQLVSPFSRRQRGLFGLRQHLKIIRSILDGQHRAAEMHLVAHLHSAEEALCALGRLEQRHGRMRQANRK